MAEGDPAGFGNEGWEAVASSRDLPRGGVVGHLPVDGEPVVVWRSESGDLVAMHDRCPHQWSSLSSVGVVDGEEIVCTTHFWRFGVTGSACKQSMGGRRDPKDPTVVLPCHDDGERVWVRTGPASRGDHAPEGDASANVG